MDARTGQWVSYPLWVDYWSPIHFAIEQTIWCHQSEAPNESVWQKRSTRPPRDECCLVCNHMVDEALARQDLVIMPDDSLELTEQGHEFAQSRSV